MSTETRFQNLWHGPVLWSANWGSRDVFVGLQLIDFLLDLDISSTRWELGRAFLIYAPGHPVQPSGWKNLPDCPGSERRLLMTEITAAVQTGQKWVHYPLSDGKFGPRQRKPRVQSHEFLEKVLVLGQLSIKSNSVACFQGQPFQNSFSIV